MIDQTQRTRILAAAAVTVAAITATFLLLMATSWLFFLPVAGVMGVTKSPALAYLLPFVVAPLVAAMFWRKPWWARWACFGFLLHNLGLLLFLELAVHSNTGVVFP